MCFFLYVRLRTLRGRTYIYTDRQTKEENFGGGRKGGNGGSCVCLSRVRTGRGKYVGVLFKCLDFFCSLFWKIERGRGRGRLGIVWCEVGCWMGWKGWVRLCIILVFFFLGRGEKIKLDGV